MHRNLSRRSFTAALLTAAALAPMGSASAEGVDRDDQDDWDDALPDSLDRKSTRLNSSHNQRSRMPSSA